MWDNKHGGLSGKARQARERSRTTRLFAQQMITECLEPDDPLSSHRDRVIRMGRRSEFLPTLASTIEEPVAAFAMAGQARGAGTGAQLVLPLAGGEERSATGAKTAKSVGERHVSVELIPDSSSGAAIRIAPAAAEKSATAVRTRPAGDSDSGLLALHQWAQPRQPFTLGGFLYGCLLGGAAAAVVLLVTILAI